MSAHIIDGKAAAARVLQQVKHDVNTLKAEGIEPALAVILVGPKPMHKVWPASSCVTRG